MRILLLFLLLPVIIFSESQELRKLTYYSYFPFVNEKVEFGLEIQKLSAFCVFNSNIGGCDGALFIENKEKIKNFAQKISEIFDVRSGSGIESKAGNLSGGNQQKAILGREITLDPPLLIAVNPTRGLDVGAIESIHKELVKHRDNGRAVLLISFELDEIFNLSDRIAVMHRGSLSGIVRPEETTAEEVGLMMAGMGGKNE